MRKLEANQSEIKCTDGKTRIFTFRVLTKREKMRAGWVVSGLADALSVGRGNMTDRVYKEIVEPCADLLLSGCVIHDDDEVHETEDWAENPVFDDLQNVLSALRAAGMVMGFLNPPAGKDSGAPAAGEIGSKASTE